MTAPDVVVIGGGLLGLSIATETARRGMTVQVLEAETPGRHAASASAGGVRSLNRHPAEIGLARAALPEWAGLAARLGADCGFVASGQIRVAEDAAAMAKLEERAALTRELGWTHEELVGHNALRRMEPGLGDHVVGALVTRDDGFADPLRTIHAYRRAAAGLGVQVAEHCPVLGVSRGPEVVTADARWTPRAVVNAAGAWGGEIAASAGEPVRVEPRALQMLVTTPVTSVVKAVIGSQGHKLSLKQSKAGHAVIGGGHLGEITGRIGRPLPNAVAASLATAIRLFPALAEARLAHSWAGIEGMTADDLPVIGPSRTIDGLFHAFGFSGHGFALAPLIARSIAVSIDGGDPGLALEPFDIERF